MRGSSTRIGAASPFVSNRFAPKMEKCEAFEPRVFGRDVVHLLEFHRAVGRPIIHVEPVVDDVRPVLVSFERAVTYVRNVGARTPHLANLGKDPLALDIGRRGRYGRRCACSQERDDERATQHEAGKHYGRVRRGAEEFRIAHTGTRARIRGPR